jgi:hypothetical protein
MRLCSVGKQCAPSTYPTGDFFCSGKTAQVRSYTRGTEPVSNGVDELNTLGEEELLSELPETVQESISDMESAGADFETIGRALSDSPAAHLSTRGGEDWREDLWDETKKEFRLAFCTESGKYEDLREKIQELSGAGAHILIGLIATAIAPEVGVASAIISPMVVWIMVGTARGGREAICNTLASN